MVKNWKLSLAVVCLMTGIFVSGLKPAAANMTRYLARDEFRSSSRLINISSSAVDDKVIMTVNGDSILETEFYERLQKVSYQNFITSTSPLLVRSETAGFLVLNSLITERLILQWANKTHQMPSEDEVKIELDKLKAQPNVAKMISGNIVSEDQLRYDIRWQKARFNIATTAASVSAEDVEKYYKSHLASYTSPVRWTLTAFRTLKQENVPLIQADLKSNKLFSQMVKTYNDDPNLQEKAGELGTIAANDVNLPAAMREVVKSLAIGQNTGVVRVDLDAGAGKPKVPSWWVLRLVSKQPESVRPFAEVKQQTEQLALLEAAGGIQVADKKIALFRESAKITVNLPGYDALLPKPKK